MSARPRGQWRKGASTHTAFPDAQGLYAPLVAHRVFKRVEPRIAQAPEPPVSRAVDIDLTHAVRNYADQQQRKGAGAATDLETVRGLCLAEGRLEVVAQRVGDSPEVLVGHDAHRDVRADSGGDDGGVCAHARVNTCGRDHSEARRGLLRGPETSTLWMVSAGSRQRETREAAGVCVTPARTV